MPKRFVAMIALALCAGIPALQAAVTLPQARAGAVKILANLSPDGLAAFHKAEIEKWWPIIKAAGIKSE